MPPTIKLDDGTIWEPSSHQLEEWAARFGSTFITSELLRIAAWSETAANRWSDMYAPVGCFRWFQSEHIKAQQPDQPAEITTWRWSGFDSHDEWNQALARGIPSKNIDGSPPTDSQRRQFETFHRALLGPAWRDKLRTYAKER